MSQFASGNFVPDFYGKSSSGSSRGSSNGVFALPPGQPMDGFKIKTKYIYNHAITLMPVAQLNPSGDPLPASIVQLSSPYGFKIVQWAARRVGDYPTFPDWSPDNDNQVPMHTEVEFDDPEFTADQKPIIEGRGLFVYGLRKPISIKNGIFHMGGSPAFTLDPSKNTVTAAQFSQKPLSTGGNENPG